MKVSATLKGAEDKLGRRTIYIRIAEGKKRKFTATQMRIPKTDWDKKTGKVKPSNPNHAVFNSNIRTKILQVESGQLPIASSKTFSDYTKECFNQWDKSKKWETIRGMTSKLEKFNSFHPHIRLSQVTPDVLRRFVEHCYNLGNQTNTVWGSLKFVRVIIRKAYKEKLIPEYPFDFFEMPKYKDPIKTYLTPSQVKQIDKYCHSKNCPLELRIAGGWFLIACYTGLRFGDQVKFNKKKIKDGRLIIYTSKTGQPVSIKVGDKLKDLFKLVDYKPLPYTNTHYNRLLKVLGPVCDIEETLSSHMARHTCAMMLANAGVSQEVTGKVLGHSSLKTTAVYYQISGSRIDAELDKIM